MYVRMYVCTYVCMYVGMYVRMYVFMYVCMYEQSLDRGRRVLNGRCQNVQTKSLTNIVILALEEDADPMGLKACLVQNRCFQILPGLFSSFCVGK